MEWTRQPAARSSPKPWRPGLWSVSPKARTPTSSCPTSASSPRPFLWSCCSSWHSWLSAGSVVRRNQGPPPRYELDPRLTFAGCRTRENLSKWRPPQRRTAPFVRFVQRPAEQMEATQPRAVIVRTKPPDATRVTLRSSCGVGLEGAQTNGFRRAGVLRRDPLSRYSSQSAELGLGDRC